MARDYLQKEYSAQILAQATRIAAEKLAKYRDLEGVWGQPRESMVVPPTPRGVTYASLYARTMRVFKDPSLTPVEYEQALRDINDPCQEFNMDW